ncbi:MAG: MerR family transcriptional regulator [Bacteroidia bacterium]|nr:MerR family transcriptional regulator [Bacteroidia bacterium]
MAEAVYSIKDVEKISGIKAHTIRIWEQRYNILKPKRTDTNIRYYNGDDLKLLLNIKVLNTNGVKISKIARMSETEIRETVSESYTCCEKFGSQVNALVVAMIELDEERFENIINRNIVQIGLEKTMKAVIYPFYVKVGLMWQTCSILPAQEHFISNLIRQKIIVAIDGQVVNYDQPAPKFILFLPADEWHEVGLLFANYMIKARGGRTLYLGQSLPMSNLKSVQDQYQADYFFTFFTSGWDKEKLEAYLERLGAEFPQKKILIAGSNVEIENPRLPRNIEFLKRIDELVPFVEGKFS